MRPALQQLLDHLSRTLADEGDSRPDGDLLQRVVEQRDDAAFAAILGRHGRLVWSVCRGMLGNDADAEDAFQATFVALFRGARQVRQPDSLGPWLHGTATRISRAARRAVARRKQREKVAAKVEVAASDVAWDALFVAVHEEVAGLSPALRDAFVACVLQGHRHEDAAAALGVPVGTLSARVSRAKARLLDRLEVRGLAPVAAAAVLAGGGATTTAAPPALLLLVRRQLADGFASTPKQILELATSVGGTTMTTKALLALLITATLTLTAGAVWVAMPGDKETPPPAAAAPAEPAALVRAAREKQAWVTKAKSLHLRFDAKWSTPGKGKDKVGTLDLAFDDRRLRRQFDITDFYTDVRVWDGQRATVRARLASEKADNVVLSATLVPVAGDFFDQTFWLWNQPHRFWFTPAVDAKQRKLLAIQQGLPEEFVLTGREEYRGVPCHVLHRKGWNLMRWYVGEKTGLLHGVVHGGLPGNPEGERLAVQMAAAHGKPVKTEEQFLTWIDDLGVEKGNPIALAYFRQRHPTDKPNVEVWLHDYYEVQPGRWFPKAQVWTDYKGTHGKPELASRTEVRATKVAVDEPLPAEQFVPPTLNDGARVSDNLSHPPMVYEYKKARTAAEWAAMRAEVLKEYKEEEKARAARDALVGTPAPPLPTGDWVGGPAVTWKELKGKTVLLVFWAEWCGPCHGCLPMLGKADPKSPFVVIGVHAPGSKPAAIERALKDAKADGLVCVDPPAKERATWGALFQHYRLSGLPAAVVIDGAGKLAAHGDPMEMVRKAAEVAEKGK